MKISMWMLYDRLTKYAPEAKIFSGEPILRSVRILSGDADIESENVYLARAGEFISGEENKIICVQGQDIILLNTDNMDDVLNDVFDAFDFYNDWAEEVLEGINNGWSLQDVLEASEKLFGQPFVIYDPGNQVMAGTGNPRGSLDSEWDTVISTGTNSLEFLQSMKSSLQMLRYIKGVRYFNAPGIKYRSVYRSLHKGEIFMGRLLLLEATAELTKRQLQLFDVLGKYIEIWMIRSDAFMKNRSETVIFRDILQNKEVEFSDVDRRLKMSGWTGEHKKELIRIEIPKASSEISQALYTRVERAFPDSYCILLDDAICLFLNLEFESHSDTESRLRTLLSQSNLYATYSAPFTDVFDLSKYNEQCRLTSEYTEKKGGEIYNCSAFTLECIRSMIKAHVPHPLAHPAIATLREYDENNESELLDTLYVYLRSSCNMARAARELNLHRNSLLYRLNQIKELTGISFENEDEKEHLLLSFYF